MRDIFRQMCGAKHPVSEAENGIAVTLIKRQKSRFIAATCACQQSFVCHATWQL